MNIIRTSARNFHGCMDGGRRLKIWSHPEATEIAIVST